MFRPNYVLDDQVILVIFPTRALDTALLLRVLNTLGSTQRPTSTYRASIHEARLTSIQCRDKECMELYLLLPICLHGMVLKQERAENKFYGVTVTLLIVFCIYVNVHFVELRTFRFNLQS